MNRTLSSNSKPAVTLSAVYASLFSIVLCMVCLAGSSWAWFTANYTITAIPPIQTAYYRIEALSIQPEVTPTETDGDWVFQAEVNTLYTITAKIDSNAKSGYLLVYTDDGDYYTTDSEFSMILSQAGGVTITSGWGNLPEDAEEIEPGIPIGDGTIAPITEPEETTTPSEPTEPTIPPEPTETGEPPEPTEPKETTTPTEPTETTKPTET